MNMLTTICLTSLLLIPLAGTAAEPTQADIPSDGDNVEAGRIAVRDGRFVDKGTGEPFRPLGVNYYRLGPIAEGKQGHTAFSPGSYDKVFIIRMMENLSRDGFNTVRSFLSNHSGVGGIVTHAQSAEVNPAYLHNLVHFLRAAQAHGVRVILSWDTWTPDSQAWAEIPLAGESRHGWLTEPKQDLKANGFRLTPGPIHSKANAIRALIEGLRKSAPDLLPVVLAWELGNEVQFNLDQEPFLSRPAAVAFGGREFGLSTDSGAQALMDTAIRSWATACSDAIHAADPEALVSASDFHQALADFSFAGVLHWHYGSPDSTAQDEFPALILFPQYGEALWTTRKAQ